MNLYTILRRDCWRSVKRDTTRTSQKFIRALAAALVTAALAPTTSVGYTDLRSPDVRDAGRASETRDYTDLRSPDARDAGAASADRTSSPASTGESNGTDWEAVGVAAGGFLVLSTLGGVVLFSRRSGGRDLSRSRPGRVS